MGVGVEWLGSGPDGAVIDGTLKIPRLYATEGGAFIFLFAE